MASTGAKAVARRSGRRWTIAEKLAIVEAAKTLGDPVRVVARRYGMDANQLFRSGIATAPWIGGSLMRPTAPPPLRVPLPQRVRRTMG